MRTGTQKRRVAKTLYDAAEPLTSRQIKDRLPNVPDGSVDSALNNLRDQGLVDVDGRGGPSDPYRHELTSNGVAEFDDDTDTAVGDEDAQSTGLATLFENVAVGDPGTDYRATACDGTGTAATDNGDFAAPDADDGDTATHDAANDDVNVPLTVDDAVTVLMALGDADVGDDAVRRRIADTIADRLREV